MTAVPSQGAGRSDYSKYKIALSLENRLVVAKGSGGGMDWVSEISRCKLLHIEQINNKVLLCSPGNDTQYPVINMMLKNIKKNVYMYMYN